MSFAVDTWFYPRNPSKVLSEILHVFWSRNAPKFSFGVFLKVYLRIPRKVTPESHRENLYRNCWENFWNNLLKDSRGNPPKHSRGKSSRDSYANAIGTSSKYFQILLSSGIHWEILPDSSWFPPADPLGITIRIPLRVRSGVLSRIYPGVCRKFLQELFWKSLQRNNCFGIPFVNSTKHSSSICSANYLEIPLRIHLETTSGIHLENFPRVLSWNFQSLLWDFFLEFFWDFFLKLSLEFLRKLFLNEIYQGEIYVGISSEITQGISLKIQLETYLKIYFGIPSEIPP